MHWKYSANASFFGIQRNRFTQYQPDRSLEDKFELIAQVKGLEGVELRYPRDFADVQHTRELLGRYELDLSAVNVDVKDATYFRYGALSASSAQARERAVALLVEAMDLAAELGSDLVTTCPLADGYDYPFQADYGSAWEHMIETVSAVVRHRADVKLVLEYQPHEPYARILLGNVGKMLYVCHRVGAPNLGANLDVGHSLAAGEAPAEAAALLAREGVLFYVHTNDNTGEGGDWDMISGTVHFWHWLEFLYMLKRVGYQGWLGGDITSKQINPVGAYGTNLNMVQRMSDWLDRVGIDLIAGMVAQDGHVAETFEILSRELLSGPGE